MKKTLLSIFALGIFSLSATTTSTQYAHAAQDITVKIDGVKQSYNPMPIMKNDRVLVPMRAIFEALGATVTWDSAKNTVIATKGGLKITLQINSYFAFKNGDSIPLDVPAQLVNDRTVVPLRFVTEALGDDVKWDASTNTVEIHNNNVQFSDTSDPFKALGLNIADTTDNSAIHVTGKIPTNIDTLDFSEMSTDPKLTNSNGWEIKPVNGVVDTTIYLRDGAGKYNIEVYQHIAGMGYGTRVGQKTVENTDTTSIYLRPSIFVQSDNQEIIDQAKTITAGLQTDLQKSQAIHDWVASHVAYDGYGYYHNDPKPEDAIDVLHNKIAVCEGYAALNAALHRAIGIPAKYINGTAGGQGHSWNEVYVDGKWMYEDTTWDAGYLTGYDFTFKLSEKYFTDDANTFNLDHKKNTIGEGCL